MNKQTEDAREIYSFSESIRTEGEKTPVAHDDKSMREEVEDYVFIKPRRRHRSSHSGSSSHHHHHRSSRKKRLKRWQKVLIGVGCGLLAFVLLVTGTVFGLIWKGQQELYASEINIIAPKNVETEIQENGDYIVYEGETYRLNENITSMLFLGVDKRNLDDYLDIHGGYGQADALLLMAFDTEKDTAKMIPIPRDTMTDIAVYSAGGSYTGMQEMQICVSYAYGHDKESSCENTLASVKRLFYNIPINTYYALDIEGIVYLNDTIGGVDVVSPNTSETETPNGTVYRFVEGETYHLVGKDCEGFIRERSHTETDASLKRMERQKAYVSAFLKQGIEMTKRDLSVPVNLFNASAPYSCTNLSPAKVSYLAKEVVTGKGMNFEFVSVPGKMTLGENDYAEYRVDEKAFFEMFLSVFYEKIER